MSSVVQARLCGVNRCGRVSFEGDHFLLQSVSNRTEEKSQIVDGSQGKQIVPALDFMILAQLMSTTQI
jgi:hypothetical protein